MKAFKVCNFRLFDSNGVKIEFTPITILTGANSSGKSSYAKAIVLLRDWIERLLDDYKRDGSFNLTAHPMDFSRTDLKLKGFKGTRNKKSNSDSTIVFCLDVDLGPLLGEYTVEYEFSASKGILDVGIINSVRLLREEEEFLYIQRVGESLKVKRFRNLQSPFLGVVLYGILPKRFLERYRDVDGSYYSDILDDTLSHIDFDKLNDTPEGKLLHKIQSGFGSNNKAPIWNYAFNESIPDYVPKKYPNLFQTDLSTPMEKAAEMKLFFYFPVLEKFKNKSKSECLDIIRSSVAASKKFAEVLPDFVIETKEHTDSLEKTHPYGIAQIRSAKALADAFEASEFESFGDYYQKLENEFLDSINDFPSHISEESYDFVRLGILPGIDMLWSNCGMMLFSPYKPFYNAYCYLTELQLCEDELLDDEFFSINEWMEADSYSSRHKLYSAYKDLVDYLLHMLLLPKEICGVKYFNDSFASVQRLHSFEDNTLLVRTVRKYVDLKEDYTALKGSFSAPEYIPDTFINKWLNELKIGDGVLILTDDEGLGFKIYITNGDEREAIADKGHGISQMISLLLLIEATILEDLIPRYKVANINNKKPLKIPSVLIIEEPEVSLHPNYQSKLASMFEDAVLNYGANISFIIETHSEYLVRKTQSIVSNYNNDTIDKNPFSVYYFKEDGQAYSLEYTRSGRFNRPFGDGFFDEASRLNYQVLKKEQELARE